MREGQSVLAAAVKRVEGWDLDLAERRRLEEGRGGIGSSGLNRVEVDWWTVLLQLEEVEVEVVVGVEETEEWR